MYFSPFEAGNSIFERERELMSLSEALYLFFAYINVES